jgi:hypothetical protein
MITASRKLTLDEYKKLSCPPKYVEWNCTTDDEIVSYLESQEWHIVEVRIDDIAYVVMHGYPGDTPCGLAIPADIAYGLKLDNEDPRIIELESSYTPDCCGIGACKCGEDYDEPDDTSPHECFATNCDLCITAMHPVDRWYLARLSTPYPYMFKVTV